MATNDITSTLNKNPNQINIGNMPMPIIVVDTRGLSEFGCKLIDAVSNAYKPAQIRKEAKAQAQALLIMTQAEIDAADLKQRANLKRRAVERFIIQEIQKQENIEAILLDSANSVTSEPEAGNDFDEDWLKQFILEAQEVSDKRLRKIWSALLRGEFQSPGKFPRRIFRVLKDLEPSEAGFIDEIAAKVLLVEDSKGIQTPFLNVVIYEEWILAEKREKKLLGTTSIENFDLLQELGLIDRIDFIFNFSVSGPMQPDKIHIDDGSARKVFSTAGEIIPEHVQPKFIRTKGPSVSADGRPMINRWLKQITFDAWKVTRLGRAVFELSQKQKDFQHFKTVKEILLKSGIQLRS
jgi:Protein of unknown function (DUF2806)